MKRLFTITTFLLTVMTISAQEDDSMLFVGNVISDTATLKGNDYRTALTSIFKSENKIEIRFITSPSFDYTNYTVLTFNQKWSAKHYYYKLDSDSLFSKDINKTINIDSAFSQLVLNNIFSLPDQDSLETNKYSYNPKTNELIGSGMAVCDGTCYYVEFKIGDLYRRYSYCNPDSYADFYPLVYELRNFADIVEVYNKMSSE